MKISKTILSILEYITLTIAIGGIIWTWWASSDNPHFKTIVYLCLVCLPYLFVRILTALITSEIILSGASEPIIKERNPKAFNFIMYSYYSILLGCILYLLYSFLFGFR